jgi:hypothetical protein
MASIIKFIKWDADLFDGYKTTCAICDQPGNDIDWTIDEDCVCSKCAINWKYNPHGPEGEGYYFKPEADKDSSG